MARKKGTRLSAAERRKSRPGAVTQEKLDQFIELYSSGYTSFAAARRVGLSTLAINRYKKKNPEFMARWQEAYDEFTHFLEGKAEEMARNAMSTSPVMLIFMLKARKPSVYRDNVKMEHTGSVTFAADFAQAMEKVTSGANATQH